VQNEIYNICGGFEQTNLDTIKKVLILYYKDLGVDIEANLDLKCNRQGQDVRYALNDDKLRALGWKPTIDFDLELKNVVEYYREKFIW
jgi:dTDP-D-glucose 4,6-dehydratase